MKLKRDLLNRWPLAKSLSARPPLLRSYLYSNEKLIDSYLEQLGGIPRLHLKKRNVEGSLSGIRAGTSSEETSGHVSIERKISFLLNELSTRDMLTSRRPAYVASSDRSPPLVHESFQARSFLVPFYNPPPGFEGLRIRLWVSAPDRSDFSDGEWDWFGSYLFLTELHFDDRGYHSYVSGCSALRFAINAMSDKPLLEIGKEVLGRFDRRSMTEKLLGLGARIGEERKMEALYRIRYMTNEQWHHDELEGRRVHDILAYPLFVAE